MESGESPTLRIAGIVDESIVDGPGLRLVVFVQGCPIHCPGCQNPETWDFAGGEIKSCADIVAQFAEDPLLAGITFSGGEPSHQPGPLAWVADRIHALGRTVMAYSGYTYERLLERAATEGDLAAYLERIDVLVDGPYVESLRSLELEWRGSSNQRVLDREAMARLREAWRAGRGAR